MSDYMPLAAGADCALQTPRPPVAARDRKALLRDTGAIPPPPYTPLWRARRGRIIGPLWIFFSPKARRIVRLRGDIMYYAWLLLEAQADVVELCEQPFAVRIKLDRRWQTAVVDIWARTRDGRELFFFPVYRSHFLAKTDSAGARRRLRVLTAWAAQSGAGLAVMPDSTIWRHPQELSNWAHMVRFLGSRRAAADRDLAPLVHRAIAARQRISLQQLEQSFPQAEPTALRTCVFRLLHAGVVRTDLREQRIGAETVFESV